MAKPHVLMVPFPMQGHVIPLMEFGQCLAKHGIKITFVNTDIIHQSIVNAYSGEENNTLEEQIRIVSIPDGLDSEERSIPGKLTETMYKMFPQKIENLILEINASEEQKITCIIYDQFFGRIQYMADKLEIRAAAFLPAAAALLVLGFNIPKLIEDGIIDCEGTPIKNQMVQFEPSLPIMSTSELVWACIKIPTLQKLIFNIMVENTKSVKSTDYLICNSVHDLEPGAFTLVPKLVPIGPLLASNRLGNSAGHLWSQDYTCLKWLDQQKLNSVIYVAFGSSTIFSPSQFQELALGLELINRPFLWVVRPEILIGSDARRNFLEGFLDRVSSRGKIIGWALQQKVLSHPSIACFLSHCGWNSTVESVSNGVPLLCWPYFADQFMNRSYICDIWKVGLRFEENGGGIITSEEIKNKVDQLFGEDVFKERAVHFKEMIMSGARKGVRSHKNLIDFINWIEG